MSVEASRSGAGQGKAGQLGAAFILLALCAGVIGGVLALPVFQVRPAAGQAFCHGILMTFFVVCPAALGGFAQWMLPRETGARKTELPAATASGFGLLLAGLVLLPVFPAAALMLWALGMLAVALDVIVTVLEGRTLRFRALPPFTWSLLATASGVVMVAPVLAAMVTRLILAGESPGDSLIAALHLPETALMLTPAMGIVCGLLPGEERGLVSRFSPWLFGVMAVLGPVAWADSLFGGLPRPMAAALLPMTEILPSVLIVLMLCADLWRARRKADGATFWAAGSLVLFSAGWLSEAGAAHLQAHSAAAFGAVMALCGGFYACLDRFSGERFPGRRPPESFIRAHAALTFAGAFLSLAARTALYGEALMGLSLLAFLALGALALRGALRSASRTEARA